MQSRGPRVLAALAAVVAFSSLSAHGATARGASPTQRVAAPTPTPPVKTIGTITIPKLKVTQPIISGITSDVFDLGVGYWPGTALPGSRGNVVLGGHRTTGARPFYDIQKLLPGDPIVITRGARTYTYVVTGSKIVKPTSLWILKQTTESTLTLFSCHPRGSVRQRYVVTATLQS